MFQTRKGFEFVAAEGRRRWVNCDDLRKCFANEVRRIEAVTEAKLCDNINLCFQEDVRLTSRSNVSLNILR